MSHRITLVCDGCETNYMIDEMMDLPPYWVGIRSVIADKEGIVPSHERDDVVDLHFCTAKCAADYFAGDEYKARLAMVDRQIEDEDIDGLTDEP